jgi:hypothetical protein
MITIYDLSGSCRPEFPRFLRLTMGLAISLPLPSLTGIINIFLSISGFKYIQEICLSLHGIDYDSSGLIKNGDP